MISKNLITGIVIALLIVGGVVIAALAPKAFGPAYTQMQMSFPTADGLVSGSDVLEAGATIGFISDIQPQRDNTALVTVQIADSHWPVHQGASASIRPKSLLGEKYIDLHDGAASAVAYDTSKTLTASSDAVPVELDQFINSLDPATRSAAQALLSDLGAGVAGRGTDLNTAIANGRADLAHLAVTGQTLANRDPELDRILVSLDTLLSQQTTPAQLTQLSQLITNSQQTLNAIQTQQGSFGRSFTDAQATLTELNTAVDSAVPSLQGTLSTAPDLLGKVTTEANMLATLAQLTDNPQVLPALVNGIQHGPSSTGGALENYPDGHRLPIFRICLLSVPGSCDGSGGFTPTSPTAAGYVPDDGSDIVAFASWMAA